MKQVSTLVMHMLYACFFTPLKWYIAISDNEFCIVDTDEFENGLEKRSASFFDTKVTPNQQHLE
ncbi:MAG: hypothetical protein ACPGYU_05190 [Flavobacteriaceae bacterium]